MLNTANIYVDLLNKIKEGGAVPPELVAEVEALDVTVNGDETTEPPTVGLVDIVADLGDSVEDLDIDINGDDTTEPPTPGLKDRVTELETTINGDSSASPIIPPLLAGAGNMRISVGWENSDATQSFNPGNIDLNSSDYDMALILCRYNTSSNRILSEICLKGTGCIVSVAATENVKRTFEYSTDTRFSVSNGSIGSTTDNAALIPAKIYLIKIMSN